MSKTQRRQALDLESNVKRSLNAAAVVALVWTLAACGSESGMTAPVSISTVVSSGPTVTATVLTTTIEVETEAEAATSERTVVETSVKTVPKTVVTTRVRTAVETVVETVDRTVQPNGDLAGALPNGDYLIGSEVVVGAVYKCNSPSDRLYWSVEDRGGEIVDNDLGAIAQVRDGYTLKLSGCNADWTQVGAPGPVEPAGTATRAPSPEGDGDLGLSVPVSNVSCDGKYAVFVGAAVTPGAYESDVERLLKSNPGAKYLRTDRACSSLVQDREGSPIYAVFQGPFSSKSSACSASARVDGATVKQLIDSGEPLSEEQC